MLPRSCSETNENCQGFYFPEGGHWCIKPGCKYSIRPEGKPVSIRRKPLEMKKKHNG